MTEIEELWHGLQPPYSELFGWLLHGQEKPSQQAAAPFRPAMLAHALVDSDRDKLDSADFSAEWKWDGIRIQVSGEAGTRRIYTRSGDEVSQAFPDLLDAVDFQGTIDGELLVGRQGDDGHIEIGSFSDLQQRLNRKTVSKKLQASHPVIIRAYDLLWDGRKNLRNLPFSERRKHLQDFIPLLERSRFDISPLIEFNSWTDLAERRDCLPHPAIEGRDAQAMGFALCSRTAPGFVVQVETGSDDRRCCVDVCTARPWQTQQLFIATIRLVSGHPTMCWCQSVRPILDLPMKS